MVSDAAIRSRDRLIVKTSVSAARESGVKLESGVIAVSPFAPLVRGWSEGTPGECKCFANEYRRSQWDAVTRGRGPNAARRGRRSSGSGSRCRSMGPSSEGRQGLFWPAQGGDAWS